MSNKTLSNTLFSILYAVSIIGSIMAINWSQSENDTITEEVQTEATLIGEEDTSYNECEQIATTYKGKIILICPQNQ